MGNQLWNQESRLNYNGFFFNKNTRLVTSFTAFDFFYKLLYLLATILSLDYVVALHKKLHFPA